MHGGLLIAGLCPVAPHGLHRERARLGSAATGIPAPNREYGKHIYHHSADPVETEKGELLTRDGRLGEARERQLLVAENEKLTGQVSRLEERIAVLERIATDPAARTAREIDALR